MRFLLSLFFLLSVFNYAQTITGSIVDKNQNKVLEANILIKDSINALGMKEFTMAKNGFYSIPLKKQYKNIYIEVVTKNFAKKGFFIKDVDKNKTYQQDFVLDVTKEIEIKEVIIKTKKEKIEISNDTVKYKVSAFADANDRKVQDVLKKMPGIDVNEKTGEIKYKGKSVETVQLDGDDLFGSNYTLGTKNINIGVVDEVQALEKFSKNKLLKGLETDESVALNLKLKKNIFDLSGSLYNTIGLYEEKRLALDTEFNFLLLKDKFKSFGSVNYNNIANNYSPFDYLGGQVISSSSENEKFSSKRKIYDINANSILDSKRVNFNQALFGTFNIVYNFDKNTSLRVNSYVIRDRLNINSLSESNIRINDNLFQTSDAYDASKKPFFSKIETEFKKFLNPSSSIEYKTIFNYENSNSNSDIIQNSFNLQNSNLLTKNSNFLSKLTFTKRFNKKSAFQSFTSFSYDKLVQNLLINNQLGIGNQNIDIIKYHFDGNLKYLYKNKNWTLNSILKSYFEETVFDSKLSILNTDREKGKYVLYNSLFINDLKYANDDWKILGEIKLSSLGQTYKNEEINLLLNSHDFLFEPSFNVNYKLLAGNLNFNASRNFVNLTDDHLLNNNVLISNRSFSKSKTDLRLQENNRFQLNYSFNNIINFYRINIGIGKDIKNGDFINSQIINSQSSINEYIYLDQKFDSYNFNIYAEKYLHFIRSTVKLNTTYFITNFKNLVNSNELRENRSNLFVGKFYIKTALKGVVNFANQLTYNKSDSENLDTKTVFSNESVTNVFDVYFKFKNNWSSDIKYEYYLPSKNNISYSFVDFNVKKRNIGVKKINLTFTIKNIFNNKTFNEIAVSDFSSNTYSLNILPRCILINFDYLF